MASSILEYAYLGILYLFKFISGNSLRNAPNKMRQIEQEAQENGRPIVNDRVSNAIDNLIEEPNLTGLWKIRFYEKYNQGLFNNWQII